MRKFLSVALGAAVVLGATPALAQAKQFGEQLDLVFSADRLFGITFSRQVDEDRCGPRDNDCVTDWTHFGLGWHGRGYSTPFEIPRLAFDVFVIDSLSIGGAIGWASYDYEDDDDRDFNDEYSAFIFSPRVGYVIMFSDVFGFWPRGGFTYHSADDDEDGFSDDDESGFAFTAEAAFVVTPVEHFGFWFGPTLDIDLSGEAEAGNDDWDRRYRTIGLLQVGLFGWI